MKTLSKILTLALALLISSRAEAQVDTSSMGALSFVNAVGTADKTIFTVNGAPVGKNGFDAGGRSFFLGFPKGAATIVAKNGKIPDRTLVINISGTSSSLVIAFLKTEMKDGKEVRTVQCVAIPSSTNSPDKSGTEYRFVLVGSEKSQSITVNDQSITLEPYRLQTLKKGALTVNQGDRTIVSVASGDPANYLVVVFPGADGNLSATPAYDEMVVMEKPHG